MSNHDPDAAPAPPPGPMPGAKDSVVLTFDMVATLLQLAKAEARQWFATLPELIVVDLYRLPVLLLAWVSFALFVACTVYALAGSIVLAAGSFFLLQTGLAVLLELRHRRLHTRMEFRETRKGLARLQAGLKERLEHECQGT